MHKVTVQFSFTSNNLRPLIKGADQDKFIEWLIKYFASDKDLNIELPDLEIDVTNLEIDESLEQVKVPSNEIASIDHVENGKYFVGTFIDDVFFLFDNELEAQFFVDKFKEFLTAHKDNLKGLFKIV